MRHIVGLSCPLTLKMRKGFIDDHDVSKCDSRLSTLLSKICPDPAADFVQHSGLSDPKEHMHGSFPYPLHLCQHFQTDSAPPTGQISTTLFLTSGIAVGESQRYMHPFTHTHAHTDRLCSSHLLARLCCADHAHHGSPPSRLGRPGPDAARTHTSATLLARS